MTRVCRRAAREHGQARFRRAGESSRPEKHDLHDRQHQREQQHDHRQRRAGAGVAEDEALLEDVGAEDFAGVVRSAAGHQVDDRKGLQRADHAEEQQRLGRRRQHRHDDMDGEPPALRAVDMGGVEHFARQVGDAGDVHEHREAGPLPDVDDDERVDRGRWVADRRGRHDDADVLQILLRDAVVGCVDLHPDEADHRDRGHHRQEEHGAEEAAQAVGVALDEIGEQRRRSASARGS